MRHGFLDEVRDWTLDGIKKKTRSQIAQLEIDIRQCDQCYKVHRPSPSCPHCGRVYPIKKKQDLRNVKGSLDKLTEDDRLAIIDENGRPIGEEYTLTFVIDYILLIKKGPVAVNL